MKIENSQLSESKRWLEIFLIAPKELIQKEQEER
jgi:hypothetical protein